MKLLLGFLIYILLWPINILMTAIAWVLATVLPLFATSDGWLPNWLYWFQTPDASLDGDSHQNIHMLINYHVTSDKFYGGSETHVSKQCDGNAFWCVHPL